MGQEWHQNPTVEQIRHANDHVINIMNKFPDQIIGFCYLNPNYDCTKELDRCITAGMKGIKLWIASLCNNPKIYPVIEQAIQYNIPILQHVWKKNNGNLETESLPCHIVEVADKYPAATFIMAHAGGKWNEAIKIVKNCRNIHIDTSGFDPETGFLELALETIGPKRILYGSDATGRSFASQIAKIDSLNLSESYRHLIMFENAKNILHL